MCGRYASARSRSDLIAEFEIDATNADPELPPDYIVAPPKMSAAVIARPPHDEPDAALVRQLRNLKWGLVPSWAKDPKIGSRLINARAEIVHEKPVFKRAFKSRRLLLPTGGFYEWFPTQEIGKSGKPLKQPFYIHPTNDRPLALAGLYEFWRDDDEPDGDPGVWLISFVIVTSTASDNVGRIYDRMPMAVTPDNWQAWLAPTQQPRTMCGNSWRHPSPEAWRSTRSRRQSTTSRTTARTSSTSSRARIEWQREPRALGCTLRAGHCSPMGRVRPRSPWTNSAGQVGEGRGARTRRR